jgi:hypothetical protein
MVIKLRYKNGIKSFKLIFTTPRYRVPIEKLDRQAWVVRSEVSGDLKGKQGELINSPCLLYYTIFIANRQWPAQGGF